MTPDDSPLESEAAFADALRSLVRRAHDGGVGIKGGWECRTDADMPDWDVLVTEVEKRHRTGSTGSAGDPDAVDD